MVQLYHATVVDESADAVIVELTGSEAFVLSCIRALERFDIIEVARSGAVALESRRGGAADRHPTSTGSGSDMSDQSVRVYYDADTDRRRLDGRTFAIVGYGSQGHAHALNLRDSGARSSSGSRAGSQSAERAKAAGLDVRPVAARGGRRRHHHDAGARPGRPRASTSATSPPGSPRARR